MNPPSSTRSDNMLPGASRATDLALPLAAVISLAIASYVVVVLVVIALQKWLTRFCCSRTNEPTTNYCCDICFGYGSTDDACCCSNSGINCCSSPDTVMNCCNAGNASSCRLPKLPCSIFKCCHETSQPIDCQSCDCCCFEIAFHLKSRQPGRPAGSDTISS